MTADDLFSRDFALTPAERKRLQARPVKRRGHAAPPGSGPAGETCASCANLERERSRSMRVFRKCGLMRQHWTHGPGSDVRAGDPACKFWKVKTEEVKDGNGASANAAGKPDPG